METNRTIEGIWHSRYEYGRGADDEPQASEHRVSFTEAEGRWAGKSLPSDEGSEVTLELTQDGNQFSGTWHERTSPTGYYRGREFRGQILLLLQKDGTELNGQWLGTSATRVKSGIWTFKRESS